MPVFYEVATMENADPAYALVRIDTDKRIGTGVEGIVVSRHSTKKEARAAAALASNTAGTA
jgi:isopentenyl diphosphate isomerase/L-lactate dehydrogenase-like FMN-dependent dehydrogenase